MLNTTTIAPANTDQWHDGLTQRNVVTTAFSVADAMLAARKDGEQ